jgi:hypothetical protein
MRDKLPQSGARAQESGVINLGPGSSAGTHWACWRASPATLLYFDSYGLPPPRELVAYLRKRHPSAPLAYNSFQVQHPCDGPICGHMCIYILRTLASGREFLPLVVELNGRPR